MTAVVCRARGGPDEVLDIASHVDIAHALGAWHEELRPVHLSEWSLLFDGQSTVATLYAVLDDRAMSGLPTPPRTNLPTMHEKAYGVFGDVAFVVTKTTVDAFGGKTMTGFFRADVLLCTEERMHSVIKAVRGALRGRRDTVSTTSSTGLPDRLTIDDLAAAESAASNYEVDPF